jgi:hypothetical protein
MTHRATRVFALLPCAALLLGASGLQASALKSEKFEIPFEFHLQNQHKTLPAGEYEIQKTSGSELGIMINRRTGEAVQIVPPSAMRESGKIRLIFENGPDGHSLRHIS